MKRNNVPRSAENDKIKKEIYATITNGQNKLPIPESAMNDQLGYAIDDSIDRANILSCEICYEEYEFGTGFIFGNKTLYCRRCAEKLLEEGLKNKKQDEKTKEANQ